MNLKKILEFELISTDAIQINVYHLLVLLIIIVLTKALLWLLGRVFKRQENAQKIDKGKSRAIFQIIKYIAWVVAVALALETMGLKITFLIASSAALLVGLGLGLQQVFQDIVSGILILFEGALKVDDIVQLEGNIIGKVKETALRTSKIETRDNIILIIPNSKLTNDIIVNWSHMQKLTRFNVGVGVAYGSDVQKVKDILLQCANEHNSISKQRKPFVRFSDFGDSSLNFELFFWTTEAFWVENIKSDLRFRINALFKEQGVQIPFPQRDVHLFKHEG